MINQRILNNIIRINLGYYHIMQNILSIKIDITTKSTNKKYYFEYMDWVGKDFTDEIITIPERYIVHNGQ